MENHHFQWENPLQLVIFNSYVKLPEGILNPPAINSAFAAQWHTVTELNSEPSIISRFRVSSCSCFLAVSIACLEWRFHCGPTISVEHQAETRGSLQRLNARDHEYIEKIIEREHKTCCWFETWIIFSHICNGQKMLTIANMVECFKRISNTLSVLEPTTFANNFNMCHPNRKENILAKWRHPNIEHIGIQICFYAGPDIYSDMDSNNDPNEK